MPLVNKMLPKVQFERVVAKLTEQTRGILTNTLCDIISHAPLFYTQFVNFQSQHKPTLFYQFGVRLTTNTKLIEEY